MTPPLRDIWERLIMFLLASNDNYVPVDFLVLDIECNASFPIILGRPFLHTVGAIIDMKEGIIRFQFPLKKDMEHFPIKRMTLPLHPLLGLAIIILIILDSVFMPS